MDLELDGDSKGIREDILGYASAPQEDKIDFCIGLIQRTPILMTYNHMISSKFPLYSSCVHIVNILKQMKKVLGWTKRRVWG